MGCEDTLCEDAEAGIGHPQRSEKLETGPLFRTGAPNKNGQWVEAKRHQRLVVYGRDGDQMAENVRNLGAP